jgi:hypothetical protein
MIWFGRTDSESEILVPGQMERVSSSQHVSPAPCGMSASGMFSRDAETVEVKYVWRGRT